jgi:Ca2+-transporting ATPase
MVTGDHPLTAKSIGEKVGLRGVIEGIQLEGKSNQDVYGILQSHSIVARATPDLKERLVNVLLEAGDLVCTTG